MSNRKSRRQTKQTVLTPTHDGFANLTARMGMGAQNVLSDGGYTFNLLTRNRVQLEAMYRGSWIVGVAIDAVAEDMTRAGVDIKSGNSPEEIKLMQSSMTRLGIWRSLLEAIKWGRLYGGGLSVINIDGQDLSTPLDIETISKGQFKGLRVYDRWQLQPSLQDIIQDGQNAGLPASYRVISNAATGQAGTQTIHHSRVIRHIGIQLPIMQAIVEEMWGESIIERLYDRLVSFDTATMGAANLIQKAHLRTVKIEGLRQIFSAGGIAEENLVTMFHHMRMLQTSEGLTLLDKQDDFTTQSYSFAGLSDMMLQFGQQISGATGIPLVRLFGQSPAGLSSTGESDMRNYYDNVAADQEATLRDGMLKILRVLHRSVLGRTADESFDFEFTSLWQTSQKEKAEIATSVTNSISVAFEKGVIDQPTALKELKQSSEYTGIFSNISDKQIQEAEIEPPPEPVESQPIPEQADKMTAFDRIAKWINGK